MRNVVERAGLAPRGTDVWDTSPTRSHEVLVMREEDRWVAWAGYYHRSKNKHFPDCDLNKALSFLRGVGRE